MPISESERPDHGGAGLAVEEAEPKTKQPPLYQVVLLNDDYTPMEFVVDVLEKFFRMDRTTRDSRHARSAYPGQRRLRCVHVSRSRKPRWPR